MLRRVNSLKDFHGIPIIFSPPRFLGRSVTINAVLAEIPEEIHMSVVVIPIRTLNCMCHRGRFAGFPPTKFVSPSSRHTHEDHDHNDGRADGAGRAGADRAPCSTSIQAQGMGFRVEYKYFHRELQHPESSKIMAMTMYNLILSTD